MGGIIFPDVRAPQFVLLGEAGLEGVSGEVGADGRLAAAPVTGVDPDDFAEQFFHFRRAGLLPLLLLGR